MCDNCAVDGINRSEVFIPACLRALPMYLCSSLRQSIFDHLLDCQFSSVISFGLKDVGKYNTSRGIQ